LDQVSTLEERSLLSFQRPVPPGREDPADGV